MRKFIKDKAKELITLLKKNIVFLATVLIVGSANANPVLNNIASGNVTVQQSPGVTQVNQSSQKAILNWSSFNIGNNERTNFKQPSGGVALNRIDASQGPSQIFGMLSATGKIILVNQAGIFFGPNSRVDVGGIIASTSDISNANFMAGKYIFDQPSSSAGSIVNRGKIIAEQNGLVALIGTGVSNEGYIQANLGQVVLASGNKFTVDLVGNQLINFTVDEAASRAGVSPVDGSKLKNGVSNTGSLIANGGHILLSAKSASGILDNTINMEGVAQAHSVAQKNGEIILSSDSTGTIRVAGTLDASGRGANQKGGVVKVLAGKVNVEAPTVIDVSGDTGGGTILVGGNFHGAGPELNASATYVGAGTLLKADAITNGNGGNIAIWGNNTTQAYGSISARGGILGGNGGYVETSAHTLDVNGITVDLRAPQGVTGTWLLDPTNIYIANNQADATAAGMSGTDSSANAASGTNPQTFSGTGTAQDSLLTIASLVAALNTANVIVTTTNTNGTGLGNITVVDPISWSSANSLTLTAANNILINNAITTGAAGSALILNAAGSVTQSAAGIIGGSGGLTQQGPGSLTLSQANTYSGPTLVNGNFILSGNGTALNSAFTINQGGKLTLDNSGTNNNNRMSDSNTLTMNGGEFVILGNATQNTQETLGALNLNTGYSTITLTPNAATNTQLDFDSLSFTSSGATALFRGINLGANTVASQTAGSSNIVFNTAPTLTGAGGNAGTPTVSIISGIIGAGDPAGNTSSGTDFMTYNPPTGSINGLRPLLASEYTNTPAAGVNLKLTASRTANDNFAINSLILAGTGGITYNFAIAAGQTLTVNSGNILVTNPGGATMGPGGAAGANLAFGTTTADIFSLANLTWGTALTVSGTGGLVVNGNSTSTLKLNKISTLSGGVTINAGTLLLGVSNALASQSMTVRAPGILNLSNSSNSFSTLNLESGSTLGALVQTGTGVLTLGGDLNVTLNGSGAAGAIIQGNIALSAAPNITVADGIATNDLTISALISGGFGITKLGNGGLTLTNANTYTGGTTLTAGTIYLGTSSTGAVSNGPLGTGTLTLNGGTLAATSGSWTVANPYIVTASSGLGGTNNFTLSGAGTLNAGLSVTNTATTTFGGVISGSGAIAQSAGTTIFSGNNSSFTGAVSVTNGTIEANNALNPFGTTGLLNLSSATLKALVSTTITNRLQGTGGISFISGSNDITFSSTALTLIHSATSLTINNTGTTTFNGALNYNPNSSLIVDVGAGKLILTKSSTASDPTASVTLNSGTLQIGGASDTLGTNMSLILNGGTLQSSVATSLSNILTVGGAATIGGSNNIVFNGTGTLNNTLTITNTGTTTFNGALSGTGGLTTNTSGIINLAAANSYSGSTAINAGTLNLNIAGAISSNSAVTLANVASAMLNLNNFDQTIGTLSGGGTTGGNISLGSGTLTVTQGSDQTYGGVISGSGALTKLGNSALTLLGTNSYTGITTINAGTLQIGAGGIVGTLGSGNVTNNAALVFDRSDSITINNVMNGSGTLTQAGTGTLTLPGANSYTGGTSVNAGTLVTQAVDALGTGVITLGNNTTLDLQVDSSTAFNNAVIVNGNSTIILDRLTSGAGVTNTFGTLSIGAQTLTIDVGSNVTSGTASLTFGATTLTDNATLSPSENILLTLGNVTGTGQTLTVSGAGNTILSNGLNTSTGGTLTKNNTGTLTLAANGNYTGATLITGGVVDIQTSSALGTGAATVSSGAALQIDGTGLSIGNALTLNGSGIANGGALRNLANNNSWNGAITLSGDTLINSDIGTLTIATGGMSGTGTALTIGGLGNTTITATIDLTTGSLNKQDSGTLTLSAANTYTGGTIVTGGVLRLNAANALGTGDVTLANTSGVTLDLNNFSETIGTLSGGGANGGNITLGTGTLTVNQASDGTYAGSISGSGGLTKQGTAILTLASANTYTGATTISAGTLQLGANEIISDSSAVSVASNATFDVNGHTETIGSLAGAGNVTLGAGALTAGGDNTSTNFSGIMTGTGSLEKIGSGIFTLSGANTYTGGTTITDGTLRLGAAGALSDTGAVTLANTLGVAFDLNGFSETIGTLSGGGTNGGDITLGTGTLTVNQASDDTYAGSISGSGGLTKQGTAILTLASANTYTGATTISAGTLQLGANEIISDSSAVSVASNATFDVNGHTETIGSLAGAGNVTLGAGALTAGGDNTSTNFSGIMTGTGSLEKIGSGIFTLSGANTYTGGTTITDGTLRLGAAGTLSDTGAVTLANTLGVAFDLNGFSETIGTLSGGGANGGDITLGTGTLTVNQASDGTYAGSISGNGGLTKQGTAILTLASANIYTGATTISAGTLQLGANEIIRDSSAVSVASNATFDVNGHTETIGSLAGAGNVTLGAGALTAGGDNTSTNFSGIMNGTGGFTKTGTGTLTFSNANTYQGGTLVSAGTLNITNASALGSATGSTIATVDSGAALNIGDGVSLNIGTGKTIILNGTGVSGTGALTVQANETGSLSGAGTVALSSDSTIGVNTSGTLTIANQITGSGALNKIGLGTLILSGANNYTGATTISNGTLQAGATNILPTALTVAANATFDLNGFDQTLSSLAGAGTVELGANDLIAGGDNSSTTFSGIMTGTGSLEKIGSGIFTLSGANTYTGGTTITDGTLRLGAAGALSDTGAVTLANTLGVAFDLNGFSETIGTLSGGGANGGDITLGTGTLTVNQASDGTYAGSISGSGGLTKQGTAILTLASANIYTGATTISAGTLQLGANEIIRDSSAVSVASNATFDVNGHTETIGSLAGAGNVTLGAGALTAGGDNSSTNFSGIMSGTGGSFTKAGNGTFTVSGNNTYTGGTTITNGTLALGVANALADTGAVTVGNSGIFNLNTFSDTIGSLAGTGSVALGSGTLSTGNDNSSTAFSGVMSGTGNLTKLGTGTFTLDGTNTYSGTTNINNGTLLLSSSGTLGSVAGGTVIGANGTLQLDNIAVGAENVTVNGALTATGTSSLAGVVTLSSSSQIGGAGNLTLSGQITGTGNLFKSGTGTTTLTNTTNDYVGNTTVDTGTLQLGAANILPSTTSVTINANGTLNFNNFAQTIGALAGSGTLTLGSADVTVGNSNLDTVFSGLMTGTGGLIKEGTGSLTLNGSGFYSGDTTINQGTLQIGVDNALSDTSTVSVASGATFDLNNAVDVIGALQGAGFVNLGSSGTGSLSVGNNNNSTIYSGVMSGTGSLTKIGSGTFTLSGANTYTGLTTISTGTLALGASGVLADTSTVSVSNGANLNLNGANETIGGLSGAGNVLLGTGTLTVGSTNNLSSSYSGIISGSGGLIKAGSGTFTVSGVNTYTGATAINAGTLLANADNVINDNSAVSIASGAIFDVNSHTETIGSLAGAGNVTLGSGTLIEGGDNTSTNYSGAINGSGAFTKTGSGTLTLSGANAYTGATTINNGILQLGSGNALANATQVIIASGATFNLAGFDDTIASVEGAGALALGSGSLTLSNNASTTLSGNITGSGNIIKEGSGTFGISGDNSGFSGNMDIQAGVLSIINDDQAMGTGNTTIHSGATLNLDSVTIAAANLTLNGSLTGTGISAFDQNIVLGSSNSIGVTAGGILTLNGILSGSNLSKQGAGLLILNNAGNTYSGTTTIAAGTLRMGVANSMPSNSDVTITSGATLDLNSFNNSVGSLNGAGNVLLGSAILTINNAVATNYAGVISGSGGIEKTNTGTLILSGINTYTGATTVSQGTLQVGIANALSTGTALAVNTGATFDLNNFNSTVGALTGNGNVTLGSAFLTVNNSNANTFSGIISGNGGLTKTNSGILTLSGMNTYLGTTTINAGTIKLGAANALVNTAALVIASNGTLDLNNQSQAVSSLNGAGNVELGTGTLTVGNSNASSTYSGVIDGTGNITKTGTGAFTLSGANTYSGITTLSNGTLSANNAAAFGTSAVSASNSILAINDGIALGGISGLTLNGATLAGIGTSSITTNNITLMGGTTNTISSTGSLNVAALIDGSTSGTASLNLAGAGMIQLNSVGENTSLASVTANAALVLAGSTIKTTANQIYNNTITLASDNALVSSAGTITLNNTVSGNQNFSTASAGATTLGNAVNTQSFTATASVLNLNGGNITTSNAQTYNGSVILGANTTLISSTGNGGITFNNAVNGNANLTMNSGSGMVTFNGTVGATTALNSINITGNTNINGGMIKTLSNQVYQGAVQLGASNTTLSIANGGNLSLLGGVSGNNLTLSGNSTAFNLGTSLALALLNVQGGTGTNTLSLQTSAAQAWTFTAANTGNTVTSGVNSLAFSNMQNIAGGSGNNTYMFKGAARLSGTINGGASNINNQLGFINYTNPVTITFNPGGTSGKAMSGGQVIATFNNINGATGSLGTLQLPSDGNNTLVITGATAKGANGYFNDPITFNGFNTFFGTAGDTVSLPSSAIINLANNSAIVNGILLNFVGITILVPPPPEPPIPPTPQIPFIEPLIISAVTGANNVTTNIVGVSGIQGLDQFLQSSFVVNTNVDNIYQRQAELDLTIQKSQSIGCLGS